MRARRFPRTVRPVVSAWIRSKPISGRSDLALAVAVGLALAGIALVQGSTWPEAIAGLLLAAPLAWRRRWPMGTLALVVCGSPLFLQFGFRTPAFVLPLMISLYTLAAHGTRRRTAVAAVATPVFALAMAAFFSPDNGGLSAQALDVVSQLGLALALGEAVRSQRAMIAGIRERADHEREFEVRRQVDEERVRIARDVHDTVAHSIATISTQASVGVHVADQEPGRALAVLEAIKGVSAEALVDLRHTLDVLRDPSDEAPIRPTPSVRDVPGLVRQARDAGLPVALRMKGSSEHLPSALQVTIYRIVQEGLTNVMRHAKGANATVRVAIGEGEVEIEVTDSGANPPDLPDGTGAGSGLAGLRQRASALGGVLEAKAEADGGFHVRATLPLIREPT